MGTLSRADALLFGGVIVFMVATAACSRAGDRLDVTADERMACGKYLSVLEDPDRVDALVSWADAEVFSRTFSDADFRIGHFSGPGYASLTFDRRAGALRLPDGLPSDLEVRIVNQSEGRILTIFLGGGRYRGLLVARDDWNASIDGRRLKEQMITARVGRVGLVCYTDK